MEKRARWSDLGREKKRRDSETTHARDGSPTRHEERAKASEREREREREREKKNTEAFFPFYGLDIIR